MNQNLDEMKGVEKVTYGNHQSTVIAVVLIIAGVALVFSNVSGFEFDQWWVLFMLIPVGFFGISMVRDYQDNGRFTSRSTGALIPILAIMATITVILFDAITWGMLWPIGFVIAGVAIILGNRR